MASSLTAITEALNHATDNGFNVLLRGHAGVGKTALIKECWDKKALNWLYFSAATIDPWVDLVGVPKEVNGKLEIIRPASLDFDNVEAIFLDEYNRAPKKVRNATMELIQFGSINGKKFPKLKVVFAAINPDDDENISYDVEKLDPAQVDRFHIQIDVPYEPSKFFFKNNYGNVGTQAVLWWMRQTDDVKQQVSPRRLQAICDVYEAKGDIQYVVNPTKVNTTELLEALAIEDPITTCERLLTMPETDVRTFFRDANALKRIRSTLTGKSKYLKPLIHLLPQPELMKELRNKKGSPVIKYVTSNIDKFVDLADSILLVKEQYSGQVVKAFEVHGKNEQKSGEDQIFAVNGEEVNMSTSSFVFTGTLSSMIRTSAQQLIRDAGGHVGTTIKFDTTHVVIGAKAGTKSKDAQTNNCVVLNENEFLELMNVISV